MSLPPPFAPSEASDASSSSSSPVRPPPHFASDSEDPSFDLDRVHTSTPRKSDDRTRPTRAAEHDHFLDDDDDPLHASDTESIDIAPTAAHDNNVEQRAHIAKLAKTSTTPPLTRRSLLQFSAPRDGTALASVSTAARHGLFARRDMRDDLYAPSPSTGSSTLVDREEDASRKNVGYASGRASDDDDVTVRRAQIAPHDQRNPVEADHPDDRRTVRLSTGASEDGDSSSPRPRRSRVGDLASYVDAKLASTSTPRRSPKHPRRVAVTPAAPGAYPPSARRPPPSSRAPSAFSSPSTPSVLPPGGSGASPASQIHDAFSRLITGPDGALAHSAERRAALAAAATGISPARNEPTTPHPAGYYAFRPTASLSSEGLPRDRPASRGTGSLGMDEVETPSKPSQLERALAHLGQAQRTTAVAIEDHYGVAQAAEDPQEPFTPAAIAHRSAIDFAMAASFEQNAAEDASDGYGAPEPYRSLQHPTRRAAAALRTSQSVRFVSPPSRRRSPSTSPERSESASDRGTAPSHYYERQRSTTPPRAPPSPPLPPLPPPLEPDSPAPLRHSRRPELLRRSHSSPPKSPPHDASLPREPPAQARSRPAPTSPARSASPLPPASCVFSASEHDPPVSPPRRSRDGWTRPASSTPPRGARVDPPSPGGTPPRLLVSPRRPDITSAQAPTLEREAGARDRTQPADAQLSGPAADDSVQVLVSQLRAAVRALTAAGPPAEESPHGEDEEARSDSKLRHDLERRRQASEAKWEERDRDLRRLELRDGAEASRRTELLDQLAETYVLEHELGYKVEELKRSMEGLGQLVGDQVAHAVDRSLATASRKRTRGLVVALLAQLCLFLFLLRLANSHALSLFQTVYHDPFVHPALFYLPPTTSRVASAPSPTFFSLAALGLGLGVPAPVDEPYLSRETRTLFSPNPSLSWGASSVAAADGSSFGLGSRFLQVLQLVAYRIRTMMARGIPPGVGSGGASAAAEAAVRVPC